MTATAIGWHELEPPRIATAVIGEGSAAAALAVATSRRVRAGAQLRAAGASDLLLVVGATEDLPWAIDVTYLAREGLVLLPTLVTPDVSVDLLAQAAREAMAAGGAATTQLALLPGRIVAFDLSAKSVDPAWLDQWNVGDRP